jgi:hypothetical protein
LKLQPQRRFGNVILLDGFSVYLFSLFFFLFFFFLLSTFLDDNTDFTEWIVSNGLACVKDPPPQVHLSEEGSDRLEALRVLEKNTRKRHVGLLSPTPPEIVEGEEEVDLQMFFDEMRGKEVAGVMEKVFSPT